jgi:hypothetical protein
VDIRGAPLVDRRALCLTVSLTLADDVGPSRGFESHPPIIRSCLWTNSVRQQVRRRFGAWRLR